MKTPKTIQITPARLLLEAGIALTPAVATGDVRAGYAMMRYGWYFRDIKSGEKLALPIECRHLESRLKALMSEELGVGVTCFLMREQFNFKHITDVSSAITLGFATRVKSRQQPDFCALDGTNAKKPRLSFIESKGTLTGLRQMRTAAEAGKLQLKNAQPAGLSGSKKNFAVSTHFAITTSAKLPAKSTTLIIDPPANVTDVKNTAPADACSMRLRKSLQIRR